MPFQKTGSPQPIEVMPEICGMCNQNQAEFNVNGQFVCGSCRDELMLKISEKEQDEEK